MKKVTLTILLVTVFAILSAFSFKTKKSTRIFTLQPKALYTVLQEKDMDLMPIPSYDNFFLGFKEALAFKESQGRYYIVNSIGYIGKYQFGKSTLNTLQINNYDYFLYSSKLQEKAFKANCKYNKWLLSDEIKEYSGTQIKGIEITESGIIAAAHLAGAGSVKRYLRSGGKTKRISDTYGTGIEQYLKNFSDYNISSLKATKYPNL